MAAIYPIPDRAWVCQHVFKKYLRQMYGSQFLRLVYLPIFNIEPEDFLRLKIMDVEVMLACLQAGAWLGAEDWQPFARYAIAKRLRVRAKALFNPPFDEIKDQFLDFQINGGTFKAQGELKRFAGKVVTHPLATPQQVCMSRLVLSTMDSVLDNTLIQPFHWIRAALATTEGNPVYGLTLFNSEMQLQKVTLIKMLRAASPSAPVV